MERPSRLTGDYTAMMSRQPTTEELFELDRKDYTIQLPARTLLEGDLDGATRLMKTYEKEQPLVLARIAADNLNNAPSQMAMSSNVPAANYQIAIDEATRRARAAEVVAEQQRAMNAQDQELRRA